MLAAIKEDYREPIGKTKVSTFNNFKHRDYDFKKLERQLLGWDREVDSDGTEYEQGSIKG